MPLDVVPVAIYRELAHRWLSFPKDARICCKGTFSVVARASVPIDLESVGLIVVSGLGLTHVSLGEALEAPSRTGAIIVYVASTTGQVTEGGQDSLYT